MLYSYSKFHFYYHFLLYERKFSDFILFFFLLTFFIFRIYSKSRQIPGRWVNEMGESEIRKIFNTEAKEIIENLESDIVKLEDNPDDKEIINRIFRYFHTLKGSSGIAGITHVYDFSHNLENLLDEVRSDKLEVTDILIDLILSGIDWIKEAIFSDRDEIAGQRESRNLLIQTINSLRGIESTQVAEDRQGDVKEEKRRSGISYYKITAHFKDNIFEFGIDPLMIIEDLAETGEIIDLHVNKKKLPPFDKMDPEKCYFSWELILESEAAMREINDVFLFVQEDNDILITDITNEFEKRKEEADVKVEKMIGEIMVEKGVINEDQLEEVVSFQEETNPKFGDIIIKKGYASENDVQSALQEQEKLKKKIEVHTVRVDTTRLDNLLNLLGEIVIGQSSLSRIADEMEDEFGGQLKSALYGLDRTTREFQEQIMSIRMIPIGPTFEQFRRFVRDSAHAMNKDIKFHIEGGETELDKTVIEKIGDPLKHMIRNSIDHGIEDPEIRKKSGKNPAGLITLKAYHQEGNVFIEIIDDGKGIDIDKVRRKAVDMNLMKPDEDLPGEKILQFLFLPGFSTAEKVGELSGRGVGMDVVKTNIEDLRGSVELKSREGTGFTVRIKLPLTLAIIDSMLVKIGKFTYIIPLLAVVETIRPVKDDIKTVEGKGEVISYRGEYLSLIRLYDIFGIRSEYHNPWEALVVIVESGDTRIGLLIDDMIGQQQIVIKSLDNFITSSRAVSGASILGDGRVALIVDIFGLIEDLNVGVVGR